MKNTFPYLVAASIGAFSPEVGALSTIKAPPSVQEPNHHEICERQAIVILNSILPQMKLRAETILARGFDSLEYSFAPDPKWPMQYVQSQVIRYIDGERQDADLGTLENFFPNPFLHFRLKYSRDGYYAMNASCKYPEKK